MKRHLLAVAALAAILLSACEKEKPQEPDSPQAPGELTVSPQSIEAVQAGGEYSITVTSPTRPKLSGQPGWITVEDGVFKDFKLTYKLTVGANESDQTRQATITVSAGTLSGTFTVSQAAKEQSQDPGQGQGPGPFPPEPAGEVDADLTNPEASAAARSVYSFLREKAGVKMLSGVQSGGTANNNDNVDAIFRMTGSHPALAGYDYIFLQYSPTPSSWSWKVDYGDISAARTQWEAGGLVSFMWHWNVPTSEEAWEKGRKGDFGGYNFYCDKTAFSIKRALTSGTWENEFILKDIEKVAGYLRLLQQAGIPVLWRPLHEAAGNYTLYGPGGAWFWWGREGAEPCRQLWKLLRDKLEGEYGLDNLIWVWTLDATVGAENDYASWYPGNDLVDIVGVDIYADDTEAKARQYDAAVALSGGHKLVTVSECGNIPNPGKCINSGQKWNWFLVWSLEDYPLNTKDYWKSLMNSEYVYTRENMPSLK